MEPPSLSDAFVAATFVAACAGFFAGFFMASFLSFCTGVKGARAAIITVATTCVATLIGVAWVMALYHVEWETYRRSLLQ